ncbi:MAG: hypothetical protein LBB93_06210 [Elusimicrobiota bacterium]|jgi:hypothetical protein|nr:hypothetical protein [Elusimicrobiota bacterium]
MENSRRKALIFVLSWLVLAVVSYMLIFYSEGKFSVAKELQKTYTIDTQEAYQSQMKGFDIQNGFLVSDESKNVSLSIGNDNNVNFKYVTIKIESINFGTQKVDVSAQSENGETFDGTIELNQGSNIINFGKKDKWQNIQLNFNDIKKNSILVFNIQNITFSEHKLSFNGSLFLFLFLFVLFGVLSFLFVYRSFAHRLQRIKVMDPGRRKALIFVLSWLVLAVVSYMLIFYSGGKFTVAKELQKTYTIDTQEAYQLQMKGFDIQNGFLVSDADENKNVSISISNGSDIAFKYITIEVESIGLAGERVNISAQAENGKTFDGTIKLNQGSNIINFGKKDKWQNIQLNFNDIKKNSILVFNIQNITFSDHRVAFNGSLFLFLFLFVLFGVLSFLFVYRSFAQWLKIHPAFILAVMLLLQVSQIIFYMDKRTNVFLDEVSSLAAMIPAEYSKGSFNLNPQQQLEIPTENRWNVSNAFINPQRDLNPRFFRFQLYIVASLFSGTLSKWFALINLFWFILTGIVLYFLSKLILKNDLTALLPPLLWGFSGATVSMTYFIRAYATVCFFAVLFLYLSCLLIDKDRLNIKLYIFLAITMFFGFFSHYYFLIWAFFICVFTGIYLLFVKRYKDIIKYAVAIVLGIGLNFLLFYNLLIVHFFRSSGHVTYAFKSLSGKGVSFIESISRCFQQINVSVFDDSLGIIFIVLGLILVSFVVVIIKKNLKTVDGKGGGKSLFLLDLIK